MVTLVVIVAILVAVLALEFAWHRHSRSKISIRIHVNGIRGKSSVVRLIAAGLRAGDIRTWAKVTGTLPNLVDENGDDIPIIRGSPSSIIEQRAVIAEAAAAGVHALVLECMALQPAFQRAEASIFRPTISVITNVRLDHEEVFGKSLLDIALALSNSIQRGGYLITSVGEGAATLRDAAARRQSGFLAMDGNDLPDSVASGFDYVEHKDNIALALAVCERAGVPRDVALAGMRTCQSDTGALRIFTLTRSGKRLRFVNALAANDPQSTTILFNRLIVDHASSDALIVLVNTRKDRPLRSRQLGRLLPTLGAQHNLIIGNDRAAVIREATRDGVSPERLESVEARTEQEVVDTLFSRAADSTTVFAIGNTAGLGLGVAEHFTVNGEVDKSVEQSS